MAKGKQPAGEWPKTSAPAQRALDNAGYTRLAQLAKLRASDLLKLHGMGPKAIGILRAALQAQGLDFAAEPKPKP